MYLRLAVALTPCLPCEAAHQCRSKNWLCEMCCTVAVVRFKVLWLLWSGVRLSLQWAFSHGSMKCRCCRMVSAEPCGIKLHLESSTMIGAVASMLMEATESMLSSATQPAALLAGVAIGAGCCIGGEHVLIRPFTQTSD